MTTERAGGAEDGHVGAGAPAHGWWPSPWSASSVAAGKVSRSGLWADGRSVYWTESRPETGGRQVVVRSVPDGPVVDVSPTGVSVRTRVHEYGGASAVVVDSVLYYVDQMDQRWYRSAIPEGSAPVALVPAPADGTEARYADGRLTASGRWLVSVEERHAERRTDHRLVAVPLAEEGSGEGRRPVLTLVSGRDFVAAPRPAPDGRWLAWVTWDHPAMSWDSSELWVAALEESDGALELAGAHRVAGGGGCSVGQPSWCGDGSLLFVDDRTGWWLPYRLAPDRLPGGGEGGEPLVAVEAEFHAPDWVLGQSTMAELHDGSIVTRMHGDGRDALVRLRRPPGGGPTWTIEPVDQPCVSITGVLVARDGPDGQERVVVLGSTPTEAQSVFEVGIGGVSTARRLSTAPSVEIDAGRVSGAQPFTAATPAGPVPGLFFAPVIRPVDTTDETLPPLVVFCHGGPTSAGDPGFDPVVQFFTSRGLAVAIVDYRGSSGYGREYRRQLDGRWGEADIDDCVRYAGALVTAGRVDGRRMAIRGTSAGGLTALGALRRGRLFAGAAAWYGVTDLESLAADTHDFESRYLDSLVGPWPEAAATYRQRSPLRHPDEMAGAVLLLQGADDPVVPVDQAERFAAVLNEHQVPCRLTVFAGEAHGFRQAATIEASLEAELGFYRWLFGAQAEPHSGGSTS
jgi:dipeptidyl aminopeptidase/acylaminoacyl peptidase